MALIYFDSSALVKLLVEEEGSDLAAELWDGCDAALASRLAYPEVCAAVAVAGRNHDLSQDDLDVAEQAWERYWASVRPVELTAAVERQAGQLARTHALRGADAVHLASALALADPDLVIAAWDRRLHAGAATAGLHVAPAELPRADLSLPPAQQATDSRTSATSLGEGCPGVKSAGMGVCPPDCEWSLATVVIQTVA